MTDATSDQPAAAATCDGEAHDWEIVEGNGYNGRAVARCCGARAQLRFGSWSIEEDASRRSA